MHRVKKIIFSNTDTV